MARVGGMADAMQLNSVLEFKNRQLQANLDGAQNTIDQLVTVIGAIACEYNGDVYIPVASLNMAYRISKRTSEDGFLIISAEQVVE